MARTGVLVSRGQLSFGGLIPDSDLIELSLCFGR